MANKVFNPRDWLNPKETKTVQHWSKTNGVSSRTYHVEVIINRIEEMKVDITVNYADWRNIGFALSHEFGEEGRTFFHRASQFHPEYCSSNCDKQFNHCLRSKRNGISIKTFFHLAKQSGVDITVLKPMTNGCQS